MNELEPGSDDQTMFGSLLKKYIESHEEISQLKNKIYYMELEKKTDPLRIYEVPYQIELCKREIANLKKSLNENVPEYNAYSAERRIEDFQKIIKNLRVQIEVCILCREDFITNFEKYKK